MKKAIKSVVGSIALVAALAVSTIEVGYGQEKNKMEKEQRVVAPYTKIEQEGYANIVFDCKVPKGEIQVEGTPRLIEMLETKVKNGVLVIKTKENKKINKDKLSIRLCGDSLESLKIDGVGAAITQDGEVLSLRELIVGGVANVDVENKSQELFISMEGVSKIKLRGQCQSAKVRLQGLGKIDMKDMTCQRAKAMVDGLGKIDIYVKENFCGGVDGLGKITVYGNPKEKDVSTDGMGKIKFVK